MSTSLIYDAFGGASVESVEKRFAGLCAAIFRDDTTGHNQLS